MVAIAATFAFDKTSAVVLAVLFVIVVPFEKLFPRHPQKIRRPQVGTDIDHALVSTPLGVAGSVVALVLALVSFAWLPGLALRPLVMALPEVPRMLLGVVVFDVAVYWAHRFGHEVPFLWRFHSVHHSTEHLDWVSGFRNHPFDGVFFAPAFVLLLVAGFTPELAGALAVAQLITGLFLHANVRWRWRPIQKLIVTPEFHHWHHANEPQAHNTNFAVFLPLWDLIFGTYYVPEDRRPQRYGVSLPIPAGIGPQLWYPLRGLRNPLPELRHPWRAAKQMRPMAQRGFEQMLRSAQRTPWSFSPRAWRRTTPVPF